VSWDPSKQECRSYFGYGSGFFMAEDERRARAASFAPGASSVFCDRCLIRQACWQDHQERIRAERPEAAADWDAKVEKAKADGIDPGRIAVALMHAGRPDPWMKSLMENIQLGIEARELAA